MPLKVVGAGVGRTGTASLKLALEQLLGGRCHHMLEIIGDPTQVPGWTDAIDGRDVDWQELLHDELPPPSTRREPPSGVRSRTQIPMCSVLLSTRDPDAWYRSASNTIFHVFDGPPPGSGVVRGGPQDVWRALLRPPGTPHCDDGHAFERHNAQVRTGVPAGRLS